MGWVSSGVWNPLSRACVFYKWLRFCVLYGTVLYTTVHHQAHDVQKQEGWRLNWTQQGTRICAISIRCEWTCSLLSISCCWRSFSATISHVSRSSCLFTDASLCMPAIVLYFSRYYPIKLKTFFVFSCIICMKSITNLFQYSITSWPC